MLKNTIKHIIKNIDTMVVNVLLLLDIFKSFIIFLSDITLNILNNIATLFIKNGINK